MSRLQHFNFNKRTSRMDTAFGCFEFWASPFDAKFAAFWLFSIMTWALQGCIKDHVFIKPRMGVIIGKHKICCNVDYGLLWVSVLWHNTTMDN